MPLLLKLLVASGLTSLLLLYASPSDIMEKLSNATLPLVLTLVPITALCMLLSALQLKILTDCHGMGVSVGRLLRINATTEFYNLFLPGIIAGGAIRWYRLSLHNNMRAHALAVVAASRLLNLVILLTIGIVGWLVHDQPRSTGFALWLMSGCFAMIGVGMLVFTHRPVSARLPGGITWLQRISPGADRQLRKLIAAVAEYRHVPPSARLALAAYAAGGHLLLLFSTWLFCLALDISVPFGALAWMRAILAVALMLPITISGLGIREGAWIYFLGLYGVGPADAFALSLLTFVRTLFQAGIGLGLEIQGMFAERRP